MAESNKVVLNFHNTLLRSDDVKLLMGPHWLNDIIISFYLEYLEQVVFKENSNLLFVSPEVVQCLKFVSRQEMDIFLEPLNAKKKLFIFFPFNDNNEVKAGGNHWSLLVFSRPESTFFHFDSLNSESLRSCVPFVCELAAAIDCPEFNLQSGECAKQTNGYDCGVHVLANVDCLARRALTYGCIDDVEQSENQLRKEYDPTQITSNDIQRKRQQLLDIIRELGGSI